MGKHTTNVSLNLFDFLNKMGKVLNYHIEIEFPMSTNLFGSQAIDIAWFNEKESNFPLFIFEIETSSNNSIANNPTKVFGKESRVFEKPLFFFHIIIDGAENSEKYSDLMGLFGKYNYGIFRLNLGELAELLIKIIAQHRRIHNEINLNAIVRLISNIDEIKPMIEFESFLKSMEDLLSENQLLRIGQVYADLTSCGDLVLEHYFNFLYRAFKNDILFNLSYADYSASVVSDFINLGILFSKFKDECKEVSFKNLLIQVQKTDTFDRIDYLPGLDYDYDVFISDYLSYYLALAFFLFEGDIDSQRYILDIEMKIIRRLKSKNDFVFDHHISWAMLMSASDVKFLDYFQELMCLIKTNGGVLDTILFCPTFINDHQELSDSKLIIISDRKEYIERFVNEFSDLKNDDDILKIAVMSLSEEWKDGIDYHVNLGVDLTNFVLKSLS